LSSRTGTLLKRGIQRLRPAIRTALEIRELQENSVKETAAQMGLSVAAAKARVFHAKGFCAKRSAHCDGPSSDSPSRPLNAGARIDYRPHARQFGEQPYVEPPNSPPRSARRQREFPGQNSQISGKFKGENRMPTITTTDGTTIYYKDWGNGQPIVFSHGWPLTADDWDGQMLFFGRLGYRVIAMTGEGTGVSTQTWDGNEMDT